MYPSISELDREPIGSSKCEHDEEEHLHLCRESLSTPYPPYVHIVVDHPDESDAHEGEYDKVGLLSVPETISESDPYDLREAIA